MLSLLAAISLACAEPDGGTCAQQVNVGPFNPSLWNIGAGEWGMYTTSLRQEPSAPQNACLNLTKYIGACSNFARSSFGSTGNGGGFAIYNGNHRAVIVSDWQDVSPATDDDFELGAMSTTGVPYRWKRVSAYEHVVAPRALTCSAQADGGCFSDSAPRGSSVRFTCPGPGICEWAPGHEFLDNVWWTSLDGMQVCVRNLSEYPLLVKDSEAANLDGDFLGGQFASLCLERVGDRWVEKGRSFP